LTDLVPVRRALISVSDKAGLDRLAKALGSLGVELVSTGGTAAKLRESAADVRDVSDVTGFPEMMDGRVKTLHPKVHGGLLGVRDNPEHKAAMDEHGIAPIDLVVVNLYPFEATVMRGAGRDEIIENIDIGGPSMVRSAAKNHASSRSSPIQPIMTSCFRELGARRSDIARVSASAWRPRLSPHRRL
jgi:phosphoribosylaminoimidazolecarboxamide formyltransferase / IMP cyclohydrolase